METKKDNPQIATRPIDLPKGLDVLGTILNPPKPMTAAQVRSMHPATKQQTSPRDKQFRGGNRK